MVRRKQEKVLTVKAINYRLSGELSLDTIQTFSNTVSSEKVIVVCTHALDIIIMVGVVVVVIIY